MLREKIEKGIKEALQSGVGFDLKVIRASFDPEKELFEVSICFSKGLEILPVSGEQTGRKGKPGLDIVKKYDNEDEDDIPGSVREFKKKVKKEKDPADILAKSAYSSSKAERWDLKREYTQDDADIRIMKIHLGNWRSAGKLSAAQKTVLENLSGTWASKLATGDRKILLDLFNDIRRKLGLIAQ